MPRPRSLQRSQRDQDDETFWSRETPIRRQGPPTLDTGEPVPDESEASLRMIKEPIMQPIGPEQLIAEVKGIYAGLIMVEAKCVEEGNRQYHAALDADGNQKALDNRQWQALIALHRTLLHEHHDFFLAIQHPAVSPALKKLAHKYAMLSGMRSSGFRRASSEPMLTTTICN